MDLWDIWECDSPAPCLLHCHVLPKMDGDPVLEMFLCLLLKAESAKPKLPLDTVSVSCGSASLESEAVDPLWTPGGTLSHRQ